MLLSYDLAVYVIEILDAYRYVYGTISVFISIYCQVSAQVFTYCLNALTFWLKYLVISVHDRKLGGLGIFTALLFCCLFMTSRFRQDKCRIFDALCQKLWFSDLQSLVSCQFECDRLRRGVHWTKFWPCVYTVVWSLFQFTVSEIRRVLPSGDNLDSLNCRPPNGFQMTWTPCRSSTWKCGHLISFLCTNQGCRRESRMVFISSFKKLL